MFLSTLQKIINAGLIYPSRAFLIAPSASHAIEETSAEQPVEAEATYAAERALEKQRIRAIMTCAAASGREKLAQYLAVNTELTQSEAQAVLSASPRAVAPKESGKATANNFFEQHRAENPELWNPQPPLSVAETIARMTHAYAVATGTEVTRK